MVRKNILDDTNMSIGEFGLILAEQVKAILGENYEADYKEILKNNGITYHALLIREKSRCVAPTIYFDSFFDAYKNGVPMKEIAGKMVEIYNRYMPAEDQNMDFFEDFSKVAGSLFFKVVNLKKNKRKLKDVPYRKLMDLAMVPLCRVKSRELGEGVITIENSHLATWEITEDELWENIGENAALTAPPKISGLMEVIEKATGIFAGTDYGDENDEEFGEEIDAGFGAETGRDELCGIYVVTNEAGTLGASAAFYPGLLKSLSEDFESDLFIIPSSIHEVLVIPDPNLQMDVSSLKEMIHEVNATTVAEEEVLSDNLYRYDFESDRLFVVKDA